VSGVVNHPESYHGGTPLPVTSSVRLIHPSFCLRGHHINTQMYPFFIKLASC